MSSTWRRHSSVLVAQAPGDAPDTLERAAPLTTDAAEHCRALVLHPIMSGPPPFECGFSHMIDVNPLPPVECYAMERVEEREVSAVDALDDLLARLERGDASASDVRVTHALGTPATLARLAPALEAGGSAVLRSLALTGCDLAAPALFDPLVKALAACSRLEALDLNACGLSGAQLERVLGAVVAAAPPIERLQIARNDGAPPEAAVVAAFRDLPTLVMLDLYRSQAPPAFAALLTVRALVHTTRQLRAQDPRLGEHALAVHTAEAPWGVVADLLRALAANTTVRELNLSELRIRDGDAEYDELRSLHELLRANASLTRLNLASARLPDADLGAALLGLARNTTLRRLDFGHLALPTYARGHPLTIDALAAVFSPDSALPQWAPDWAAASLGTKGAAAASRPLRSVCGLGRLMLGASASVESTLALATALGVNTSLLTLKLSLNSEALTPEVHAAFAASLASNSTLVRLKLVPSLRMKDAEVRAYADAMQTNRSLCELRLESNSAAMADARRLTIANMHMLRERRRLWPLMLRYWVRARLAGLDGRGELGSLPIEMLRAVVFALRRDENIEMFSTLW